MPRLLRVISAILALVMILSLTQQQTRAAQPEFPDVPTEASYAEAVHRLAAEGILRGYPDGNYGPEYPLLRAQAAVTIVRAMGLGNQPTGRNFNDRGDIDDETWTAVLILANRNIARGFPDGSFQATSALTRQQALSFLSRAMTSLGFWQPAKTPTGYGDVSPDHAMDVATYLQNTGAIPQTAPDQTSIGAQAIATRGWYAEVLWIAIRSQRAPATKPAAAAATPSKTATPPSAATTTPRPPAVTPTAAPPSSAYSFGTLLSNSAYAPVLYAAGVRVVHLELGWDNYEPREGAFDANYAAAAKQKVQAFRDAGLQVVIGVGLQYPPAWVYALPNSRYVDQRGTAAGPLNLTFNQALRQKASAYIARVHQDLDLNTFAAVRIGSGGLIESLYPSAEAGGGTNSYWGFDTNAQGGAGRPASIPGSPYPGWQPGQTSYQGRPFTTAEVQRWYDWYLGAMVDGIIWQSTLYDQLGFRGDKQVLMPGLGSRPDDYSAALANYLNGAGDGNHTMGRAAVWHKVIAALAGQARIVIYISSLADGSGGDNPCLSSDPTVGLNDPQINSWSAARWLSYNANRYGMAKNGENPGRSDTTRYGIAMLQAATRQMQSCGMQGMMWAHESNLFDNTSGITLGDYTTIISNIRR